MVNPIVCLDFDGVIHSYSSGWQGVAVVGDAVVPGAMAAILDYQKAGFDVAVYSSRSKDEDGVLAMKRAIFGWLVDEFTSRDVEDEFAPAIIATKAANVLADITFPAQKPPAFWSLDDRVGRFTGVFPSADYVKAFRPWNK